MRRAPTVLGVLFTLIIATCGGDSGNPTTTAATGPGHPVHGEEVFNASSIVCHGPGGTGIEGLGKPLTTSPFVAGLSDAKLLEFLIVGRPSDDPLNTTGIAMPPRGGNPSLTDADLMDVIAYVRTINGLEVGP